MSEPETCALPLGFTDRMRRLLGAEYPAFLASYDKPRRPALRVNPLRLDGIPDGVRALLPFLAARVPFAADGWDRLYVTAMLTQTANVTLDHVFCSALANLVLRASLIRNVSLPASGVIVTGLPAPSTTTDAAASVPPPSTLTVMSPSEAKRSPSKVTFRLPAAFSSGVVRTPNLLGVPFTLNRMYPGYS